MTRKRNSEKDLVVSSSGAAARPRRASAAARPKHSQPTSEIPVSPAREPDSEAVSAASASSSDPSHDEIARLAYSFWLARGCEGGSPEEDWRRAEQELRQGSATATATAIF